MRRFVVLGALRFPRRIVSFPSGREEFYGVLAYHYSLAEEWARAQDYLVKAGDQAGRVAADAEALAHYRQAVEVYARAFGDRWDPRERAALERKIGEALFRRGDHRQALEYFHRALRYLGAPDPTSRWGIRVAIIWQAIQQLAHRLLPRLMVKPATTEVRPEAAERCRIYALRSWIDYFVDQERLVLDVVTLLNFSERSGNAVDTAHGSTGVGFIFSSIPLLRLAGYYHRRRRRAGGASPGPAGDRDGAHGPRVPRVALSRGCRAGSGVLAKGGARLPGRR